MDAERASGFFGETFGTVIDGYGLTACTHASYVDDAAFPGFAHASQIISNLRDTAIIVHETIVAFMFEANYSPGKTEAI